MHPQLISEGQHSPSRGVLVPDSALLGLWLFLGTVTMLFAAFTSAYLVRSAGPDWETTPLPAALWINTVVLIARQGDPHVGHVAAAVGNAIRHAINGDSVGLVTV